MSEVAERPIPSGEILVFRQHISDDGVYIIECERCPDVTLSPAEMGSHSMKVHLRNSFHVETRDLKDKNDLSCLENAPTAWWMSLGEDWPVYDR